MATHYYFVMHIGENDAAEFDLKEGTTVLVFPTAIDRDNAARVITVPPMSQSKDSRIATGTIDGYAAMENLMNILNYVDEDEVDDGFDFGDGDDDDDDDSGDDDDDDDFTPEDFGGGEEDEEEEEDEEDEEDDQPQQRSVKTAPSLPRTPSGQLVLMSGRGTAKYLKTLSRSHKRR